MKTAKKIVPALFIAGSMLSTSVSFAGNTQSTPDPFKFYKPLSRAAAHGDLESATNHIDSSDDHERGKALVIAAEYGYTDIVALLLFAGVNPNSKDELYQTGLMLAAQNGHEDVVEAFIDAHADLNMRALDLTFTALEYAIWQNNNTIVQMLIDGGADINLQHKISGETPLIRATKWNNVEAVAKLIEAGANLDTKITQKRTVTFREDEEGKTALVYALERGYTEIAQLLNPPSQA